MPKQFTLGRNERLKSRKAIEHLFDKGQRFNLSPFRVFYYLQKNALNDRSVLQAGFAAGSRHFKTAVRRNRVKRLAREAWRLQKNQLIQLLNEQHAKMDVFIIYTGRELPVYSQVVGSIKIILDKLMDQTQKRS